MTLDERKIYTEKLAGKLPTFRKELGVSQQALADKAGLSRSTITKVEGKRQTLPWSTFLALFLIFKGNSETAKLLKAFEIDTDDVNAFLSGNNVEGLQ